MAWSDAVHMSARTLWDSAQNQPGLAMVGQEFRLWRRRQGYSLDEAAKAPGISRRMVAHCEMGDRPIPRAVTLATKAPEAARPASRKAGEAGLVSLFPAPDRRGSRSSRREAAFLDFQILAKGDFGDVDQFRARRQPRVLRKPRQHVVEMPETGSA